MKPIKRVADQVQNTDGIVDEAKNNPEIPQVKFSEDRMVILKSDTTLSDSIRNLLGKVKGEAQEVLGQLKTEKKISEFRFMPLGAVTAMDYKPNRVTLTVDTKGFVVSADLG